MTSYTCKLNIIKNNTVKRHYILDLNLAMPNLSLAVKEKSPNKYIR